MVFFRVPFEPPNARSCRPSSFSNCPLCARVLFISFVHPRLLFAVVLAMIDCGRIVRLLASRLPAVASSVHVRDLFRSLGLLAFRFCCHEPAPCCSFRAVINRSRASRPPPARRDPPRSSYFVRLSNGPMGAQLRSSKATGGGRLR